jgi:hypothetical protein
MASDDVNLEELRADLDSVAANALPGTLQDDILRYIIVRTATAMEVGAEVERIQVITYLATHLPEELTSALVPIIDGLLKGTHREP